ncbi:tRNA (guanine(46)-N(7))-methyltransferase TrmB [Bosea sp. (in: a-proteobacteria)]|jgi:tRNA (guanine-N7-)-methyltransferase|uniref:tRNA (guanine(46)-N(7))-methyltransferase TrmB n=1 Tax=Bosea sp. (in: a-proteobacteria) TaxID=1871050 RepID=UPI002DDCBBF5|nr:tRNA (guanine(46)-N(7))-methyltransferase TrmB [Bosea sp. (in: a-proteobacteria)]HEV2512822.1 tRNA (guanine(46)-N(7))-methyltransferase TrmB [Bosea sp. (in: a-proteobacteria)]
MTEQHDPDRAFFGRRKGKGLRQGQAERIAETLPALRLPEGQIQDLKALFPIPVEAVRLEIGFGGGEHLLARMRESPQIGFIGVEPFINGMAKFLAVIEQEGLRNIRLWDGDAALLLPQFPEGSIDAADLLYPDPWPKRRQRKRRFVSERTLSLLARVLRPGGRFRFASDIDDYVGWTLARLAASPDFDWIDESADEWRQPYPGWVRTRYEAKAIKAGRVPSYLTAHRRAS